MLLYLQGDRDGWAAHADEHGNKDDRDHVRSWAAQVLGVADAPDDWAAMFDLYDQHLAAILRVPAEDLAKLRQDVSFTDPAALGCGEEFPVDAVGVDGHASADNRRVDVLFFDEEELPEDLGAEPPGVAVYGGDRYKREYMPVGALGSPAGHADFELFLELRDHFFVKSIASKPYEVRGPLPESTHVRAGVTDAKGRLREAELGVGEYLVLCDGGFTVAGSRLTEVLRRDVAADVHRLHGHGEDEGAGRSFEYADSYVVFNAGPGDFIEGPLAEISTKTDGTGMDTGVASAEGRDGRGALVLSIEDSKDPPAKVRIDVYESDMKTHEVDDYLNKLKKNKKAQGDRLVATFTGTLAPRPGGAQGSLFLRESGGGG